jgi:hypothetical protein
MVLEESPAPAIDTGMGVDLSVTNTPEAFQGYTLFNLYQFDSTDASLNNTLVIMDMDGTIVAEKYIGDRGGYNNPAEFIDPNTILTGTAWGAALWHLENDTLQLLPFGGHHEYEYNPNSNTIFTFHYNLMNVSDVYYRFDYIREFTLNGTLVWELDTHDFISEEWWCPSHDKVGIYRDISHSNTIFYDAEDDMIYYNARNPNTFFKINHTSSEVLWSIGEYGNYQMYDIHGDPAEHLFFHAHAVEKITDTRFILFDNDYHNQTSGGSRRSRILELEVNETAMTAREVWSYQAPSDYYSAGWGDADILPNGNRIGDWGYPSTPPSGVGGALVEVNPEGEIVWETRLMNDIPYRYGSYRLERFRYAPIISSPPDVLGLNQPDSIGWDVWYNYRNKEALPGNYSLYLNGSVVLTGDFTYAQFWNPTHLDIPYGELGVGIHNLTLEVSDGYGHTSSDTVLVSLENYFIDRSGYTTLEKGQESNIPTWSGSTISELVGNVTLNGTLFMSLSWTGQDFSIDPDLIDLGSHYVEVRLYNNSISAYNDTFWILVTPTAPPGITPLQTMVLPYDWDNPMTLSWDLYDVTAHTWKILLNGSEIAGNSWTPTSFRLDWDVPILFVGTYNITVVVDDDLGHISKSECILMVLEPPTPRIYTSPGNHTIIWGSEEVSFTWELAGGDQVILLRNGTVFKTESLSIYEYVLAIDDWRADGWRPGIYNLTLIYTRNGMNAIDTIWVEIIVDPGDPYADSVVTHRSQWVLNAENAIGAPDGLTATIYPDYEDGYLSLDMGEQEEIIDGIGYDFRVNAHGGEYRVYVANTLDIAFEFLGVGSGVTNFDLRDSSLNESRYIRIQYQFEDDVELDAIEAFNYNAPPVDEFPPVIEPLEDLWLWIYDNATQLKWSATDDHPWMYEVYFDSVLVESGPWNGSDIEFSFEPEEIRLWNVSLVLYDVFDNFAMDSVFVHVRDPLSDISLFLVIGASGIFIVVIIVYAKKKSALPHAPT